MRAAKRSPTCIRTGGYYGRVNAGTNGTMRVTIVARTVPEDTIGVGQISFTLTPGNIYGVSVRRQAGGSGALCLGCDRSAKVPFTGSARATTDSLWFYIVDRKPCPGCVY